MLTKLRTNPGAFDVVLINSAFTGTAKDEDLIAPIDVSSISHFADIALRQKVFTGATATCVMEWQQQSIKVSCQDDEVESLPMDSQVWLSWPVDKTIAFDT